MADFIVCKNSDIAAGQMLEVKAGHKSVVLFRDTEGNLSALENRCSHAEVKLSFGKFEGQQVECRAHGARFDVKTGRHLCMPAVSPVRKYAVKVVGDDIVVSV